ncbi:MAG: VOC family protein [Bacteroidota bacterium]
MHFTQIKETCLYVSDLDACEAFYHGKLEMPVISKVPGRHIFFKTGSSVLLCFIPEVTAQEEALPPHFAKGPQHIAFECEADRYQEWKSLLEEKDIPMIHEQAWPGGYHSAYFLDPDGHVLEIVPKGMWEEG